MKVMAEQKILSVLANSADANYPDDNVIDEHPKKLWKAASGVSSATLTFEISGGTGGLALFNTNALTIDAVVQDANAVEWFTADADWFATDAEWASIDAVLDSNSNLDGVSGAIWLEWPHTDVSVQGVLTLTCSSTETLFAGVAVADKVYEYHNPQYGVREGLKSYSITRELQNGAFYRKERDVVRTFSFNMIEERRVGYAETISNFYEFMYTVSKELGYKPAAWQLADMDKFWWVVYARFDKMPSGNHSMPSHSGINVQLIEVL